MTLDKVRQRSEKIYVIWLLGLVSLVLVIASVINSIWSPILGSKVQDIVTKSTDSLYKISFSSVELHILRGSIEIKNVTIKADTAVYNSRKKKHLAPNNLLGLHIKRLTLSNIHPFLLYFRHRLDIGKIILSEPELSISYRLNHTKDTVLKDRRSAWERIRKNLSSVQIGKILLGDVKFRYNDYSGKKPVVTELKELYISATDLLIDSATQTDKSRFFYCKDIEADLNNYSSQTANGLYNYKIKSLKLSPAKSELFVQGISLTPLTADAFFNKSKRDRFTLRLDSLRLHKFDFLKYQKYRTLYAKSLSLYSGALEVFGNPSHVPDSGDRVKSFPNVGLFKINPNMKIDTILVNNLDVVYKEDNVKSKKTGLVAFNKTSGKILNVTTSPSALKKDSICTFYITTYFMNRGKLDLQVNFNLTDSLRSYSYRGKMGPMDLKYVNQASIPLGMIKITSGTLKELSFDIHANRRAAKGKVKLLYNNLKVNVFKPDTNLNKLQKQTLVSYYANLFILKRDNPDYPDNTPRVFYTSFERDRDMAFFKYTWQTLLSGIKPAVGLDKKMQQAVQNLMEQRAIDKQQRKVKKAERIKRREERRKKRKLNVSIN